jgi:hypothetical protein
MSDPGRDAETGSAAGGAREDEIREALRPHERDGWIDCRDALAIAARLGVPPSQVGRLCDRAGIKIANCQLGCFGMRGKHA